MPTFAIGDIHGCLTAFDTLLDAVAPSAKDTIITLGDYTDRGPDSCGVINRLLNLAAHSNLIPIRGNHDLMMCDAHASDAAFRTWFGFGGDTTLASYGVDPQGAARRDLEAVPEEHWHFLRDTLRDLHETDSHFFVHALAESDVPLDEQPLWTLRWARFHEPQPHLSGKVMVVGHTAQHTGEPVNLGHAICIDTWIYGDGWLTCMEIDNGRVWQANEQGELRVSHIERYRTTPSA